jgi:SAM-dependent methyltransferase
MADITGDQRIQSEVLEGLATAVNHRRWFVELALPYLGDNPIEIGSGLGDYALEWAENLPRFTATEADPDRLVQLKERLADHPNIDVRQMLLPTNDSGQYSAAVSYNVLEHIEDHVGALRSMATLVRPGGRVVLIVPAFMFAMSQVDIATGHVRRYTKKSMRAAMTEAGLEVEKLHYANALGRIADHQGRGEHREAAVRPVGLRGRPYAAVTHVHADGRRLQPAAVFVVLRQPLTWKVGQMTARANVWKARLKPTYAGVACGPTSSASTSMACTAK